MRRRLAIGVGAAVAVLAAGGGIAVLAWPSGPGEPAAAAEPLTTVAPDPAAPEPRVRAVLTTVDLSAPELGQRATKAFSLVGVTWTDPAAKPAGAVQVRTRSVATGAWSGWRDLEPGEGGADPGTESGGTPRGSTEPLWAGPSNGVAARIAGSSAPLPAGLRLELIDPGTEKGQGGGRSSGGQGGGEPDPSATPTDEPGPGPEPEPTGTGTGPAPTDAAPTDAAPTDANPTDAAPTDDAPAGPENPGPTEPAAVPTTEKAVPAPVSTVPLVTPLPAYTTRAQWSADEKLVTGTMSVASQVRVVFVHHTAETNDYSCADSAKIIRSIQAYHVKSRGWSDIGYNFLVDKCGKLFEGRRGGVTNAVVGAHTYGFNTNSAGIAVLGHYSQAQPSPAAELTVAQVAASRLGAYGFNPTTTAKLTEGARDGKFPYNESVTFQRVAGHRDGVVTECPGSNLYARLPAIRSLATNVVSGLALKSLTGATSVGGVHYTRTGVTAAWTVTTPAAQLAKQEVRLDGRVVATPAADVRSAAVPIAPGAHTLVVRVTHVSGATAELTLRVVGDVTAPAFPGAPAVALRGGTYATGSVPVTVTYRVSDNVKLGSLAATSPSRAALGTGSTAWYPSVRPGGNLSYSLTARDVAGNSRTVAVNRKVTLLAESKAKKSGSWSARSGGSYLNGKALAATRKNAKLTFTFTGRSAALVFARGAKTGKAYVYLDGKKVATVDTRAGKNAYRQALWVKGVAAKKHTVAVVVAGTGGRPTVTVDGLAYIG